MRDVPLRGARSLASASSSRFDMVGLHWQGTGSVEFRTRSLAGRWSGWQRAAPEAEDVPDDGTAEARAARGWRLGNPYWVGASDRIAYRLRGNVMRLRAYFVKSPEERVPLRRLSLTGSPPIIMRPAWKANEAIRRAPPSYARTVQLGLVHHTAGSNSYTASQSAAIVRGIEIYHVKGNGWNDIGYNFLVDKYGQVFEGRYGGIDKNVIGAHAEGFNTGSFGVALLGTYQSVAPTAAAKTALVNLLAWRMDIAHVDPLSTLTFTSGGNGRFSAGTPVFLRAVSGHKDTGFTSCPGTAVYGMLGALARQAAAAGLPKLYAPLVQGQLGGLVRFRGRLSEPLPWTVTVADEEGVAVATGTGTSDLIDWTWDASTASRRLLHVGDHGRRRRSRRDGNDRYGARRVGDQVPHGDPAHDQRLDADRLHAHRAGHGHRDSSRGRRKRCRSPVHAAAPTGEADVQVHGHQHSRGPLPGRAHGGERESERVRVGRGGDRPHGANVRRDSGGHAQCGELLLRAPPCVGRPARHCARGKDRRVRSTPRPSARRADHRLECRRAEGRNVRRGAHDDGRSRVGDAATHFSVSTRRDRRYALSRSARCASG